MSVGTLTPPPTSSSNYPPAPPRSQFRLWTLDEYHRMIDAGILSEGEQVELLDGWILHKLDRNLPRDAVSLWPNWPPVRRFTVDEYHRMIQTGILKEGEPVELLEGWVIRKMARNTPHEVCSDKTEDAIRDLLPVGWRLRVQKAIRLSDSEPEPDCAIVEGGPDRYLASHPVPAQIAFVVEISDSTLTTDQTTKLRAYARAGIATYWIVNIPDRQVEVYSDPTGPTTEDESPFYRSEAVYAEGESVPVVIGGTDVGQIAVGDILPSTVNPN